MGSIRANQVESAPHPAKHGIVLYAEFRFLSAVCCLSGSRKSWRTPSFREFRFVRAEHQASVGKRFGTCFLCTLMILIPPTSAHRLHAAASAATAADAAGLYPTDGLEAAKCDAIMDSAVDFRAVIRPSYLEQDQAKKVSSWERQHR